MNLNQRIDKIRKDYCDGNNKKFAELLEVSEQYASNICNHRKNIGEVTLNKILEVFPDINPVWLKMGIVESLSTEETNTINSILPGNKCTNPDCIQKIKKLTEDLKTANEDKSLLKEHIGLLKAQIEQLQTEKGAEPPGKRDPGSMEKPGENKKAS